MIFPFVGWTGYGSLRDTFTASSLRKALSNPSMFRNVNRAGFGALCVGETCDQVRRTSARKPFNRKRFVGTAWFQKYPLRFRRSQALTTCTGSCRRWPSYPRIEISVTRIHFLAVSLASRDLPFRSVPQHHLNTRKSNVSG